MIHKFWLDSYFFMSYVDYWQKLPNCRSKQCDYSLKHYHHKPSLSSSRSSSQSCAFGICPPFGCWRLDLPCLSASPPASQPPSVCFQRWCSPSGTCGRSSSPGDKQKCQSTNRERALSGLLVVCIKLAKGNMLEAVIEKYWVSGHFVWGQRSESSILIVVTNHLQSQTEGFRPLACSLITNWFNLPHSRHVLSF